MALPVITDEIRSQYSADGVAKIPKAIAESDLEHILDLADAQLAAPGEWVTDTNPGAASDRLFTTRYLWRDNPTVHSFAFGSGVGRLAADIMGAASVRLYFDHLLIKEPHTVAPTPWHQDIPYWPFLGRQICSVWVACTESSVTESSLEFVRGSHLWNKYYAPKAFDGEANWTADFEGEECPDIEADRGNYDIIGFDVEPGDALAFSSWIIHGSPPNAGTNRRVAISTRWLGPDATWSPHAGCDPTITQADTTDTPGQLVRDDDRFPIAWPQLVKW